MRISDWSSDVCSSDLRRFQPSIELGGIHPGSRLGKAGKERLSRHLDSLEIPLRADKLDLQPVIQHVPAARSVVLQFGATDCCVHEARTFRSEEHTSELQSLMRISYAVFCLKKKTYTNQQPL